jgi:uncharacterized protein YkwD
MSLRRRCVPSSIALPLAVAVLACGAPVSRSVPQLMGGAGSVERRAPSALELRVHELVNDHRRSLGLAPLAYSAELAAVARVHSEDMAAGRVPFGHDGFDARAEEVLKLLPYSDFAENVAYNDYGTSDAAQIAVSDWLNSREHRERIEGDYGVTGVGIAVDGRGTYYFTQLFVKRE